MKKALFVWFLCPVLLWPVSQPRVFSPVPIATNTVINLETAPCDERCLERLLQEERLFSFLARYENAGQNRPLQEAYQRYSGFFNLGVPASSGVRMAVLIPSDVIGRYSVMVAGSVSAYLLSKNEPFELRVFDSVDESPQNLMRAITELEAAGFKRVLAALTAEGAETLARLPVNAEVFIPTVNRSELSVNPGANLFFGGIDYAQQLGALSRYQGGERTIAFDEPIPLSQKISAQADATCPVPPVRITINNPRINFSNLFKTEGVEHNTTLLLNTQPVRTSLILSQVTFNDINISAALSTQINFNPLILTLTQNEDVEKFYVASAIGESSKELREMNALMQNDLRFNWIPYATTVLADLISQRQRGDFSTQSKQFKLTLIDNQIQYPVTVYQIRGGRFIPAPPPQMPAEQISSAHHPSVLGVPPPPAPAPLLP